MTDRQMKQKINPGIYQLEKNGITKYIHFFFITKMRIIKKNYIVKICQIEITKVAVMVKVVQ